MKTLTATSGSRILAAVMAVLLVFALLPVMTVKVTAAEFDWSDSNNTNYDTVNVTTAKEIIAAIFSASTIKPRKIVLLNDIYLDLDNSRGESNTCIDIPITVGYNNKTVMLTSDAGKNYTLGYQVEQDTFATDTRVLYVAAIGFNLYLKNIMICKGGRLYGGGGGGVSITGSVGNPNTLYIQSGTVISGNSAMNGGGIWAQSTTVNVYDGAVISGNKALLGGGIYVSYCPVNIYGGEISGNTAEVDGGGIRLFSSPLTVFNGVVISGNTAGRDGGGIFINSSNVTVSGGKISGNTATRNGGGLYVNYFSTVVNVSGGEISGNHADEFGGGIYTDYYPRLTVGSNAIFFENTAPKFNSADMVSPKEKEIYDNNIAEPTSGWSVIPGKDPEKFNIGYNNCDINYEPHVNSIIISKYQYDANLDHDIKGTGLPSDGVGIQNIPLSGVSFDIYYIDGIDSWNGIDSVSVDWDDWTVTITTKDGTDIGYINFPVGMEQSGYETDENGVLTFSELKDGLYLVVEGESAAVMKPAAPFLVNLPMKNPEYTPENGQPEWLTDVYVYPKNETIKVEKLVDGETSEEVEPNSTVTFTITIEKPNNYDGTSLFKFSDELDGKLMLIDDSITIEYLLDGEGTFIDRPTTIGEQTITIHLSGVNPDTFDHVVITFKAKVSAGFKSGEIPNTANVLVDTVNVSSNTVTLTLKQSYELPHTGGEGLIILTIVGVVIVGGGAAWMLLRKKKREE